MKITDGKAIEIKVEETLNYEDILSDILFDANGNLPKELEGCYIPSVIGQRLNGITYTLTCLIPLVEELGPVVEYNNRQYRVTHQEHIVDPGTYKVRIVAVHKMDTPKGCRFYDPKIEKWFRENNKQ